MSVGLLASVTLLLFVSLSVCVSFLLAVIWRSLGETLDLTHQYEMFLLFRKAPITFCLSSLFFFFFFNYLHQVVHIHADIQLLWICSNLSPNSRVQRFEQFDWTSVSSGATSWRSLGRAPPLCNTRPFPSSDICFSLQWGGRDLLVATSHGENAGISCWLKADQNM